MNPVYYLNGQLLEKWIWAFQRHQNKPPNLTPFLSFLRDKSYKNLKKFDSTLNDVTVL